jgi:cobalamin biosynthesis Mg chelatase CobN
VGSDAKDPLLDWQRYLSPGELFRHMMPYAKNTRLMLLLAILVAAAMPAASMAQGGDEVIRDCAQDGDLDGNYSQDELDDAHDNLPSDIDEYSTCRDVIENARASGGGDGNNAGSTPNGASVPSDGSGGGGASPGGAGNDLDELDARGDRAQSGDAPQASVAGEEVGTSGETFTTDAESDGMPAALIVALILAALGALAGALYLLRDYLPPAIKSRLPGPLKPDSQV